MKKKRILVGGLSLILFFSFVSVAAAQAHPPVEANNRITVGMAGMGSSSMDNSSTDNDSNETSHDMDMDKPDVQEEGQKTEEDGHGQSEKAQGKEHGEEEPVGVNWPVVWSFLGINSLVIVSAGILKFMK